MDTGIDRFQRHVLELDNHHCFIDRELALRNCRDASLARPADLPQPMLNFRLDPEMPEDVWQLTGEAVQLQSLPNFFNNTLIFNTLIPGGIAPEDAVAFDFTACNRVNLPGKLHNIMRRIDHFNDSVEWFHRALHSVREPAGTEELLAEFKRIVRQELNAYADEVKNIYTDAPTFRLDLLIFDECRMHACDVYQNGADRGAPQRRKTAVEPDGLRRIKSEIRLCSAAGTRRLPDSRRLSVGTLHLGITMTGRETLEKARLCPEEYRTLCIRKYGFSEFFVALSPEYQQEIIDRTEYQ